MNGEPHDRGVRLALHSMVGFFGINEKPTSSKDPLALRRTALGTIRTIIENKKDLKINDLLIYSSTLYEDQGFKLLEKSNINLNPLDTKDYKNGVWTLPPRLILGEKNKRKYLEIGESERMTLKFIKP